MAGGKQPLRGTRTLGSKRLQRRPKPKGDGGSGKPRSSVLWPVLGLVGSFAALWLFGSRERKKRVAEDQQVLQKLRSRPLRATEHGACRMDCRHIPASEVREVLRKGSVNRRKSVPGEAKYVVDGSIGGKNVQGVFSAPAGDDATYIVTVIDKDSDWKGCVCP